MIEGGESPTFLARRLVIFASEDVGNAEPQALVLATAAAQAADLVGYPEAALSLTQAAIYLALAPKSNAVLRAMTSARRDVEARGSLAVPPELRNPATSLAKSLGHGEGYRYPHDFPDGIDPEHGSHLPAQLRDHLPRRRYVEPGSIGWEAHADRRLRELRRRGGPGAKGEGG
jgi:putative ATPase